MLELFGSLSTLLKRCWLMCWMLKRILINRFLMYWRITSHRTYWSTSIRANPISINSMLVWFIQRWIRNLSTMFCSLRSLFCYFNKLCCLLIRIQIGWIKLCFRISTRRWRTSHSMFLWIIQKWIRKLLSLLSSMCSLLIWWGHLCWMCFWFLISRIQLYWRTK